MNTTRLLKYSSRIVLSLVLLEVLVVVPVFAYLELHTYSVITIHQPDPILNPGKMVVAGTPLIYEIRYCKHLATQAAVTRTLVGPVVYPLPASTNNVPVGCTTAVSRNTIVPVGVQPGTYHLELSASYVVNWLGRRVPVTSRTEDFTVVASSASSGGNSSSMTSSTASSALSGATSPTTSPAASPQVFGTDPVTQEPTQLSSSPGVVSRVLSPVTRLLGGLGL